MRLSAKIFAASLFPLLVLIEVAGWSLNEMNRLVRTNRTIVNRALPARRATAVADELVGVLARNLARWVVLPDANYEARWRDRALELERTLDGLTASVTSHDEQAHLHKATIAFERYRDRLSGPVGGTLRLRPLSKADLPAARRRAERIRRSLGLLGAAIDETARRAQQHAAGIEERTWRTVLLALPGSALLAILLSFVVSVRATRALRRVATASTLLAQGTLSEPVGSSRHDEIGDLARAFDAMAARLGELDRLKEQVFSHLAHEIRTPLTSIREATHLLADGVGGPLAPRQERLVGIIGDSTDRLLQLLNRILDLSRLRAGLLPLDQRPVRIEAVAARALHELRPQAEASGVRIEHPNGGPDPWVLGDEERLVEVVVNLVRSGETGEWVARRR